MPTTFVNVGASQSVGCYALGPAGRNSVVFLRYVYISTLTPMLTFLDSKTESPHRENLGDMINTNGDELSIRH